MGTKRTTQFYYQYLRWHPNGIKTIPHNLCLNGQTLLHWFEGDGYSEVYRGGLSSHSFTKSENNYLKRGLEELGIRTNVQQKKENGRIYYYLRLTNFNDFI